MHPLESATLSRRTREADIADCAVYVAIGRKAGLQGLTTERPLPAEFRAFSGSAVDPEPPEAGVGRGARRTSRRPELRHSRTRFKSRARRKRNLLDAEMQAANSGGRFVKTVLRCLDQLSFSNHLSGRVATNLRRTSRGRSRLRRAPGLRRKSSLGRCRGYPISMVPSLFHSATLRTHR